MKNKRLMLILTVLSVLLAPLDAQTKQKKETLEIYLPREITVEGSSPELGQVAIIRGSETLSGRAKSIGLGYLAAPDQHVVINRNIVLSRLACNGIAASDVTLKGAQETVIKRRHQCITSNQIVEEATVFLKNNLPDASICQLKAIRTPGDLILPGTIDTIKLTCRLVPNSMRNQCKVQVAVFDGNQEVGRQDVVFGFRYQCRKVVAKTPIAKGELINSENTTIENGISNYPEPAQWVAPYGQIATRSLPADTVITANMVSIPKPEVLLKRNQSVAIKIENAGLIATATGKTLQDGVVGEYIKVQNIDSKIIIMAKVNEDGTVEPVF
jgi:flagella basal body P-ring formation protein FlgA